MSEERQWSEQRAREVAEIAARHQLGSRSPAPELVRLGTNGVFTCAETVIRVSPPGQKRRELDQQLALARWLDEREFPTAAPLSPTPQRVEGLWVSFYKRLDSCQTPIDQRALGQLLRRFHELTDDYDGELARWEPLGRLGERLLSVPCDAAFSEDDRRLLGAWRDHLTAAVKQAPWELAAGPLHGDVHTGNVVQTKAGLYLIDLDRIAHGPREWDLAQTVASQDRFAGRQSAVDAFMRGYGWDLRGWPASDDLVRLRLLFMTSWLLTLPRSEAVQAEIRTRMAYWRDPDSAPRWQAV